MSKRVYWMNFLVVWDSSAVHIEIRGRLVLFEGRRYGLRRKLYTDAFFHAVLFVCGNKKDLAMKTRRNLEQYVCVQEKIWKSYCCTMFVVIELCALTDKRIFCVLTFGFFRFVQQCDFAGCRCSSSLGKTRVSTLYGQVQLLAIRAAK